MAFDEALLSQLLGRALRHGGEFADVFCERRRTLSYRLQDGRIHDASYGVTLGVGIRVVVGESAGYACSDDLSVRALTEAADAASLIASSAPNGEVRSIDLSPRTVASFYDVEHSDVFDAARYVAMLQSRRYRCAALRSAGRCRQRARER